jgi:protein-L-isoaspartate(D-aspartate) O-methyltransferase
MSDWGTRRNDLVDRLARSEDLDDATERAMRAVPRHLFVPETNRDRAYDDAPLPIGDGQTISAPHMVAIMTDLLDLQAGDDVLEIGTGCGYHAAVTAAVVGEDHVYSVEYHDRLARSARRNLAEAGYEGVSVRVGDGKEGWPEHAPYERAYLTCAADRLPQPVLDQVRTGGLVLAPVGSTSQVLVRGYKRVDGTLDRESHGRVRFVPLK